jgi:hypothetical protein
MNVRTLVLFLFALVLTCPQVVRAQAVIQAGREDEITSLFGGIGVGLTSGWRVEDIAIPMDRIHATLRRNGGGEAVVALTHPDLQPGERATPSFGLRLLRSQGLGPDEEQALLTAVATQIAERDDGRFWITTRPEPSSSLRAERPRLRWSPGSAALLSWGGLLLGLLVFLGLALREARPWRSAQGRWLLTDLAWLTALAWCVRTFLVLPGPANFYSHLPIPPYHSVDIPTFGPGFHAWLLPWFLGWGASDELAFSLGAAAGALAIIPCYLLTRDLGAGRVGAVSAALLLSVWQVHMVLSSSDDSAVLIATLICTGVMLARRAETRTSAGALVAAWACLALAATVRPEASLAFAALGAWTLYSPALRRLQFSPACLAAVVLLAVWVAVLEWRAVSLALQHFSPSASLEPRHVLRLFGLDGASILCSPYTAGPLLVLVVLGCFASIRRLGARTLLVLLIGLLPALPTVQIAQDDLITKRYQLPLVPLAACWAGFSVAWLAELVGRRMTRGRLWARSALAGALLAICAWSLAQPLEEPTFRLEYRFFRAHLASIPEGCRIVRPRWTVDLGLAPPIHLSVFLGLAHVWIDPTQITGQEACLALWRPSSCHANNPERVAAGLGPPVLDACAELDRQAAWEPLAETWLPARTGFCETYTLDPVPVGFFLAPAVAPALRP